MFAVLICFIAIAQEHITDLNIDGKELKDIKAVRLSNGGKVLVMYPDGGTSFVVDKLPPEFLASWGIKIDAAENFARAESLGLFREVDGTVYDLRKAQPEWVKFSNMKVFQITREGSLIESESNNPYSLNVIFVRRLPSTIGDRDQITFLAKASGSYSYINKAGDQRTVRAYDCGRVCTQKEIPEQMIKGNMASAPMPLHGEPAVDVVSSLPQSDKLKATGSGFFVTEDGYLITNHHVVEDASSVKVKMRGNVFTAKVIEIDKDADLALLKVTGKFTPLVLSATDDAKLGQSAFTIGFPNIELQGLEPKYTDGKISSLAGIRDDPDHYQISVQVQPGNSGGPLLDDSGTVIGIVVARLNDLAMLRRSGSLPQNVNYAIKVKLLRKLLAGVADVNLPKPSTSKSERNVQSVESSVAMVLVY
ncbi:MAG: hypothetical protein JWM68_305 [Verrucomicrobiales bacterium]|nr:hypothetical protein [Verrucomicrobiales bacterium]